MVAAAASPKVNKDRVGLEKHDRQYLFQTGYLKEIMYRMGTNDRLKLATDRSLQSPGSTTADHCGGQ
ncbi:hypothetical protein PoB_004060800 [Plakobranchus ocellatus]|uniref:Uncharacterized protein n=1 Tax=Plakobranchus ocellatus TaxID=259542 RepID=A0AAV4B4U6_9GAST|nr:hypothetical protein PoB_004060800 [Plakobranchus ocellatus]